MFSLLSLVEATGESWVTQEGQKQTLTRLLKSVHGLEFNGRLMCSHRVLWVTTPPRWAAQDRATMAQNVLATYSPLEAGV